MSTFSNNRDELPVFFVKYPKYHWNLWGISANVNPLFVPFITHSFTNSRSADNYNCVRLGLVKVGQQIKSKHSCYRDDGSDYRGTVSVTVSGQTCKPWHLSLDAGSSHGDSFNSIELMGGHNYCRNPTHNGRKEDQPWCFTNDPRYGQYQT